MFNPSTANAFGPDDYPIISWVFLIAGLCGILQPLQAACIPLRFWSHLPLSQHSSSREQCNLCADSRSHHVHRRRVPPNLLGQAFRRSCRLLLASWHFLPRLHVRKSLCVHVFSL
ncbi:hypothetical protein L596_026153 [Steinernema carpocapsae]|uniref:Uncharacterized protein n=1 Tax=Steinernema carpocapsae TaxID=34508 RepID=A0A4U5M0I2_STECR|nr:hypothetical protein L596_026153 [Steinernema carpocapsae]